MIPRKTELALTTLQSHRSPLTLLQRRALILADGQRDLATLAMLLGGDGTGLVQSLCAMGYLGCRRCCGSNAHGSHCRAARCARSTRGPTGRRAQRRRAAAPASPCSDQCTPVFARYPAVATQCPCRCAASATARRARRRSDPHDHRRGVARAAADHLGELRRTCPYTDRRAAAGDLASRVIHPRDLAVVASARRPARAESLNMRRGWSRAPHHRNGRARAPTARITSLAR